MASPPFSLNIGVPTNSDVAANFPTLDRSDKDVVQSWITTQWNTQGHSLYTLFDRVGSANGPSVPPTPSAGTLALYYDSDNVMRVFNGDLQAGGAGAEVFGVPAGTIICYAGTVTPNGYLPCAGTAVSRTEYSRLFAAIGTAWGAGDGSTTFNIPDLRGMAMYGRDNLGGTAANRITVAGGNFDGTHLASTQVLQGITLTQANLPSLAFTATIAAGQGAHTHSLPNVVSLTGASFELAGSSPFAMSTGTVTGSSTLPSMNGTISIAGGGNILGSSQVFGILGNAAIVQMYIKW